MNSVGLPNMYWQLLPPSSGGYSYNPNNDSGDPFGIYTNSGVHLAGPINGATSSGAAQDWTGRRVERQWVTAAIEDKE
ncbi:hypothetical protein FVEG_17526 [Fusarium verticillioides 7600]|uniref:Uncharacterized protein n=1 Tax=Gibberella moniliformis (strain M3125 / FGSC 7600) TaxID=334819 RepID=W7MW06_GIBM7|nr:hypothetical protein FVEG_17526 [Fusarium verticillioides 7600]EWG55456.1 hypothetical protein FVEG_17526 [Fusarium verticillioides 7600]